jgi:hypothetical protein
VASPTEVRRALAARLPDLNVRVTPAAIDYATDNGFDVAKYTVRVRAGDDTPETEERLDRILARDGGDSVKRRLEADSTLGGLVNNVQVIKTSGYQLFPDGVLGATFTVQTL